MAELPALFISHGAPTLPVEDVPARAFLAELGHRLARPRAILVVSAHWETGPVSLLGTAVPPTIHDFFGFPAALYDLAYPAPGAPELARALGARLAAAGFEVSCDEVRGLDHGAWVPLLCMYPDAGVPVMQLSICPAHSPLFHWRLGRVLADLRHDGVLVIGSGALTHNLDDFRAQRRTGRGPETPDYARAFCTWVAERIDAGDGDAMIAYRERAPNAARAHPTTDHFLPMLVALGAAGVSWRGERLHHSFMYGVIGMDCYAFVSNERRPALPGAA